jgi:hypothetical protein
LDVLEAICQRHAMRHSREKTSFRTLIETLIATAQPASCAFS